VTVQFPSRLYPRRRTKSLAGKSRSREAAGRSSPRESRCTLCRAGSDA